MHTTATSVEARKRRGDEKKGIVVFFVRVWGQLSGRSRVAQLPRLLMFGLGFPKPSKFPLNSNLEGDILQSPKKSQLSGWQTLKRKNFLDEVRKLFLRHVRQKCADRFHNIYKSA